MTGSRPRIGVAVVGGLALIGTASTAAAYCRTTTCDTADPDRLCPVDVYGCVSEGEPLYWPDKCLSFGVHEAGSPKRNLSYEDASRAIQHAFRTWASASCDGRPPSFRVWELGAPHGGIVCDRVEFNKHAPNANIWMFRDDEWPYSSPHQTLALTTITFEAATGRILDADVELNSANIALTVSTTHVENDLVSIATHEAGHVLGLAHSLTPTATMNAQYTPRDLGFRELDPDDVEGICAAYPPDREAPDCDFPSPPRGFSRFCAEELEPRSACAAAVPGRAAGSSAGAAVLATALLVWRRRRDLRSASAG